jgi:UDP-N-acetylglucosamine 2-epimerase (non-hydrolysing)
VVHADVEGMEIHLLAGTRPEAIKLAPVATALAERGLTPVLVASGQHPVMVHQALDAFALRPHETLDIERGTGRLAEVLGAMAPALDALWQRRPPAAVVVQGDTLTTLAGALVAFWSGVHVVHLEAGLRSHDLAAPFPEEANRKLVAQITALHLPPTETARRHLAAEGISGSNVVVTGNTAVDAVLGVAARNPAVGDPRLADALSRAGSGAARLLLVTVHRRESWGEALGQVLDAVAALVAAHPDVEVVLPAHPNPAVREQVERALGETPRVLVTEPLPYAELVAVLAASTLVLSDSGGIQEEAPSFGVPVLVLRDVTERTEAVRAGCALLLGTRTDRIVAAASRLLHDTSARAEMTARGNPFGDGRAAVRAADALEWLLGLRAARPEDFVYDAAHLGEAATPGTQTAPTVVRPAS